MDHAQDEVAEASGTNVAAEIADPVAPIPNIAEDAGLGQLPPADRLPDQAAERERKARRAPVRGLQGFAECVLHVPGGKISYHPSKNCFEARCFNRNHGQCAVSWRNRARLGRIGGHPLTWQNWWTSSW